MVLVSWPTDRSIPTINYVINLVTCVSTNKSVQMNHKNKTKYFTIRVTDNQKSKIAEGADRSGVSMTDYVLSLISKDQCQQQNAAAIS